MQTEQLLCWSGMTDTEHTTSGSNEEADGQQSEPHQRSNLLQFHVHYSEKRDSFVFKTSHETIFTAHRKKRLWKA